MLKARGLQSKTNIIAKTLFEKSFDENYKSLVVLANPKTVLNVKYATKDIKEKIGIENNKYQQNKEENIQNASVANDRENILKIIL